MPAPRDAKVSEVSHASVGSKHVTVAHLRKLVSYSPLNPPVPGAPFCAFGIDVGGTKIAAGIVTFPGARLHARRVIPTQPARGGEAVLADVEQLVAELAAEARAGHLTVQGIGAGVCELVDCAGNLASAHCLAWLGLPVRERLASLAPAVIEADVRAAALGE